MRRKNKMGSTQRVYNVMHVAVQPIVISKQDAAPEKINIYVVNAATEETPVRQIQLPYTAEEFEALGLPSAFAGKKIKVTTETV
jgi:hypothetical protein